MRVFIAGVDGYLGWPLAQYLASRGHRIAGTDRLLRRQWVEEIGSHSAIPIASIQERLSAFDDHFGDHLIFRTVDLLDYPALKSFLLDFQPDAVVHLAEMPSAAYSMIDQVHAAYTQHNNVIGSLNLLWAMREACPIAHLVKLGTMGEYGTPNLDIPEGFFEIEYRGRKDFLPFPKQANSFYHWSKVHDSNNTMFACRIWGLRATDIMQGVVYGTRINQMGADQRLWTRFDFDPCFGTVINRFCCQAVIEHPLTIYGAGGQTRGFLPLRDSMQCMALIIENPPAEGEYRVFNQFEQCYNIEELAFIVQDAAIASGLKARIEHYDNPRQEHESHYYNPACEHLVRLGYKPTGDMAAELKIILNDLIRQRERIACKAHNLLPDIRWDGTRVRSDVISKPMA